MAAARRSPHCMQRSAPIIHVVSSSRSACSRPQDADGRVKTFPALPEPGVYRVTFETAAYFEAKGQSSFYPYAAIVFTVRAAEHHHIPLLLSPFGYTTYRGS